MKNILKYNKIILVIYMVVAISFGAVLNCYSIAASSIMNISGPASVEEGKTITLNITFSDNVKNIWLSDGDIIKKGFSGTVKVNKVSDRNYTVIISNVSSVGAGKYIVVNSGVGYIDSKPTDAVTSSLFEITAKQVVDENKGNNNENNTENNTGNNQPNPDVNNTPNEKPSNGNSENVQKPNEEANKPNEETNNNKNDNANNNIDNKPSDNANNNTNNNTNNNANGNTNNNTNNNANNNTNSNTNNNANSKPVVDNSNANQSTINNNVNNILNNEKVETQIEEIKVKREIPNTGKLI